MEWYMLNAFHKLTHIEYVKIVCLSWTSLSLPSFIYRESCSIHTMVNIYIYIYRYVTTSFVFNDRLRWSPRREKIHTAVNWIPLSILTAGSLTWRELLCNTCAHHYHHHRYLEHRHAVFQPWNLWKVKRPSFNVLIAKYA